MFRSLSQRAWNKNVNGSLHRTSTSSVLRGLSTNIGLSSVSINAGSNDAGPVSDSSSNSFSTFRNGRQVRPQFSFDDWKTKKIHHRQSSFVSPSSLDTKYDVVIIGGGVVGSMIALHLANLDSARKILVIERDSTYRIASAQLSAGGCRQQFSLPENIRMGLYGAEFIKNASEILKVPGAADDSNVDTESNENDVQWKENGYLTLAGTDAQVKALIDNSRTQNENGVDYIPLLSPDQLKQQFPWINTDDLKLGAFGTANEGFFDPNTLVLGTRRKAIAMGVHYLEGAVTGATMRYQDSISSDGDSKHLEIDNLMITCTGQKNAGEHLNVKGHTFVNAAGAWSGKLVDMLNENVPSLYTSHGNATTAKKFELQKLPIERRKRCIFHVHAPKATEWSQQAPLVVDPSGTYFRPEGGPGYFICGAPAAAYENCELGDIDREDDALDHLDNPTMFEEYIWPAMYERCHEFEELKVKTSWAGFYDFNYIDHNAIIGKHSDINNLLLCNGFSGHGLMQAPAAGLAISELIEYNEFKTIDLKNFGFERIMRNAPYKENCVI